ncbi:AI-2E family transporter [Caldilinea sp.]|uniref:AI-2E family transporter n=1 Tax=Caldilinea sp. TaxID=2293560 RepID=UPI002C101872|nr:AI-2E family transporter [Anaerolineales bacterium]HQY91198.1 AI-2E family transporter [Caldilinea sp.]
MKRFALIAFVVLLVLSFLVIVWRLQNVVYIFLVALLIAATLERPIERVQKWGAPRWLAVLSLYLVAMVLSGAVVVFLFTPLISELDPFVQDILSKYGLLQNQLAQMADTNRGILILNLPRTDDVAAMIVTNPDTGIAEGLITSAQRMLNMLGELALAFVISVYWSMGNDRFERIWLSLVAPAQRTSLRRFINDLEARIGAYVRSELAQTVMVAAVLAMIFILINLHSPLLVAALVAFLWLIPIYGGALAVIVAMLGGWFVNLPTAALAAGATFLVLLISEYLVQPRLYRGRHYWGILMAILLLALGDALGLIGLLIAPPVALLVQMVIERLLDREQAPADLSSQATLASVCEELSALKARLEGDSGQLTPTVKDLTARLDKLVDDAATAP